MPYTKRLREPRWPCRPKPYSIQQHSKGFRTFIILAELRQDSCSAARPIRVCHSCLRLLETVDDCRGGLQLAELVIVVQVPRVSSAQLRGCTCTCCREGAAPAEVASNVCLSLDFLLAGLDSFTTARDCKKGLAAMATARRTQAANGQKLKAAKRTTCQRKLVSQSVLKEDPHQASRACRACRPRKGPPSPRDCGLPLQAQRHLHTDVEA